jgi:endonuclease/exonuclease/phosphatase family metal-dependent hydrolase
MKLKLLTWNVFWGLGLPNSRKHNLQLAALIYKGSHRERKFIPEIAAAIKRINPDIVTLHEIDDGTVGKSKYNHIKEIALIANFPYVASATERRKPPNSYGDGNALLARTPLKHVSRNALPYKTVKRNYVVARHEGITIVTTHLAGYSYNAPERLLQIKALCKYLKRIKGPIILMGDFNAKSTSEEFLYLVKHSALRPIFTAPTFPIYAPEKDIDNMLVSKHFKVLKKQRLSVKLSDHYPLYAEVEL